MACKEVVVNNVLGLVRELVNFVTDPAQMGAGNQWTLLTPATVDSITNTESDIILKGVGDGTDEIYIGIRIKDRRASFGDQTDVVFNGFAGYDSGLSWEEQPGAIYHKGTLPIIPLVEDSKTRCWFSANSSRIVVVCQLSTQYESAYIGFMKPIAVERQYPYPLIVAGSYVEGGRWSSTSAGHTYFADPGSDTWAGFGALQQYGPEGGVQEQSTNFKYRRPDGTWRCALNRTSSDQAGHFERACIWPQNVRPTKVLTVLDSSLDIENVAMFPCMVYETYPSGILGQLDGVYFIGNREDLSAKDTILYKNKPYKVFNNVFRRDNDSYFVIEWF